MKQAITLLMILNALVWGAVAVQAQTLEHVAAFGDSVCHVIQNEGGIVSVRLDGSRNSGFDRAEFRLPTGPELVSSPLENGCYASRYSLTCTDETRNAVADVLPTLVAFCGIANTEKTITATFSYQTGIAQRFTKFARVTLAKSFELNQQEYYRGQLPSCSSIGHTGKSIHYGVIVCDKYGPYTGN